MHRATKARQGMIGIPNPYIMERKTMFIINGYFVNRGISAP